MISILQTNKARDSATAAGTASRARPSAETPVSSSIFDRNPLFKDTDTLVLNLTTRDYF